MFHHRLRILVLLVALFAAGLIARAAQLQIAQASRWSDPAGETITATRALPASRGRILDVKGKVLAEDQPCIDVAVTYRALVDPMDPKWLDKEAQKLARKSPEWKTLTRAARREFVQANRMRILADAEAMWDLLAAISGQTRQEINEKRLEISDKVQRRSEKAWRRGFERKYEAWKNRTPRSWIVLTMVGDEPEPKLEDTVVEIFEELESHIILPDVNTETANILKLQSDHLPGLSLLPGVKRVYPYNEIGAHVIGHLARVTDEDLRDDEARDDPDRRLLINDDIGRAGIEKLAQSRLHGTRGEMVIAGSSSELQSAHAAKSGLDVTTTIDIELQRSIHAAFENVRYTNADGEIDPALRMPGAAVVIHIPTGQVRAMVSYPSYDLNKFEQLYSTLLKDELEQPMINRATSFVQEPGSTIKPLVGIAAITQGLISATGTIECDGYLKLDGRAQRYGRCWTMSVFKIAHHRVPSSAPHPTGFLNCEDALERSCNVYFETLGDKLKLDGLSYWYGLFGLGRPTGVGLPERSGVLPNSFRGEPGSQRAAAVLSAIGQSNVLVTPIQLANVAATIGRAGVWVRPRIIADADFIVPKSPTDERPDRMTLDLAPQAIAAAQRGMFNVVNNPAGTGSSLRRDEVDVSGKTGTATASKLSVFRRDEAGALIKKAGDPIADEIPYGTREKPDPRIPWYRVSNLETGTANHAWVMGYLPSEKPEYAFAVFVQYGNKGGTSAGSVGVSIIQALEQLGYVTPRNIAFPAPSPAAVLNLPTSQPSALPLDRELLQ